MQTAQDFSRGVLSNVGDVIVGKEEVIEHLLIALLCEGHVLLEDVPGVGKTMMARALSVSLGVDFRRLQCTPDLLPRHHGQVFSTRDASVPVHSRPSVYTCSAGGRDKPGHAAYAGGVTGMYG